MDKEKLFSIGDVAKMFHLSVESIRHYEKLGLISPEYVDPESKYRYYGARQFEVLNSIRYLRALDMPLCEIADFLSNRDVWRIEEKLREQKKALVAKIEELERIEKKIDNRLQMIEDAKGSVFDEVMLVKKSECRMVWVGDSLKISGFLDMEKPIRKLEERQKEALVFLGKVGVGISEENLNSGNFERYDGIFLLLDKEDIYDGKTKHLPESLCVCIRFCGSHTDSPKRYCTLCEYILKNNLKICGFSREITMIDYGFTGDKEKFVTEIAIPVKRV